MGLSHQIELKYFDKNKNPYWLMNFKNVFLMRCRHCHFPQGSGENILKFTKTFCFKASVFTR
jgi:hypothetical protein